MEDITAKDESEKGKEKDPKKPGSGQCMIAAIDTPGAISKLAYGMGPSSRVPPPLKYGIWKVIGRVTWDNGNKCEVEMQVQILPTGKTGSVKDKASIVPDSKKKKETPAVK